MIDAFATELQFVDHLAAVWHALPTEARGKFLVHRTMTERARKRGIEPVQVGADDPSVPVLVASYGDHKKMRAQGRRRIAYIEHGAGQGYHGERDPLRGSHGSYAGGRDRADVSLFLMPNHYSADLWRRAYPGARVEVVGCPKLDTLPVRQISPLEQEPVVAVAFHWDCRLVPETRSAYTAFRWALPELARRWQVIGHGHPRAIEGTPDLRREYAKLGIELVPDFEDVCRRADVLAFDNTSAGFEFAATGRPVVVMNAPMYRRDVHHGLRFWDAASIGPNVWHPDALMAAVELALTDPPEVRAAREAALDIVYPVRSGASERAAAALLDWAGVLEAVA